jgi:hypothetical protein
VNASDEAIDAALQRALRRRPVPAPDAELVQTILGRVSERESSRRRPRQRAARVVLGVYWLAAAVATTCVVARSSFPAWASSGAWALAVALVPVGYGAALWPRQARECFTVAMRLLAPLASRR